MDNICQWSWHNVVAASVLDTILVSPTGEDGMHMDSLKAFEECFLIFEYAVKMTKDRDTRPEHWRFKAVDTGLECPPDEKEQGTYYQAKNNWFRQQQVNKALCQRHVNLQYWNWACWLDIQWLECVP
ncbi:hypothetical protein FGRMN_7150 [Fusarium graminum]|nr:hypothetical protein FGRMN_7150 [Fusarium graminum]